MPTIALPIEGPLDLVGTLRILVRGHGDRTIRLAPDRAWWTTQTADGPATVRIRRERGAGDDRDHWLADAFGPGAGPALARAARLIGTESPLQMLDRLETAGSVPYHPTVMRLARRYAGVRLPRTAAVFDALLPAILEQKVTGAEARHAWHGLVRQYGEPAPGPHGLDLRLPPSPATLARLPYHAFHPFGIERRRADLIRSVATRATWFEDIIDMPAADATARLMSVPGIGPWTANEVSLRALGDPDAVSVGDFHLPTIVAWTLVREPRADDARMLALLEPYAGRRALVVRLIELGGARPPRYGPRLSPRRIDGF